ALNHLATLGERLSPTVVLAAWFHDAIYRGEPERDEQRSAQLAVEKLGDVGIERTVTLEVHGAILATIPGNAPRQPPHDVSLLLDADLSILGASSHRYREYADAVRAEYPHVPESRFRAARAEILVSLLARPEIYRRPAARALWEERARSNLSQELLQ